MPRWHMIVFKWLSLENDLWASPKESYVQVITSTYCIRRLMEFINWSWAWMTSPVDWPEKLRAITETHCVWDLLGLFLLLFLTLDVNGKCWQEAARNRIEQMKNIFNLHTWLIWCPICMTSPYAVQRWPGRKRNRFCAAIDPAVICWRIHRNTLLFVFFSFPITVAIKLSLTWWRLKHSS